MNRETGTTIPELRNMNKNTGMVIHESENMNWDTGTKIHELKITNSCSSFSYARVCVCALNSKPLRARGAPIHAYAREPVGGARRGRFHAGFMRAPSGCDSRAIVGSCSFHLCAIFHSCIHGRTFTRVSSACHRALIRVSYANTRTFSCAFHFNFHPTFILTLKVHPLTSSSNFLTLVRMASSISSSQRTRARS